MNVLLVSANKENEPYPVYPLGLDYVLSAISDRHDVRVADMNVMDEADGLRDVINAFSPNVVGVSIRNIDNTDALDRECFITGFASLLQTVRKATRAPVVLGGSGFSIMPAEVMHALEADYGIIGEGERFGRFLDALEKGGDVTALPGVIVKGGETHIPEPWQGYPERRIHRDLPHMQYYLDNGGILNLQTKRGCRFNCVYCTYPHIEGRTLRTFPPEKVAETALALENAGAKYIYLTDSIFNADYAHSMQVARTFIQKGLSIPWGAYFSPTRPPGPGYYTLMADAGLTHIEFGTDALCDATLAGYQKPFRTEHVFQAHDMAVEAGIHIAHFLLFGGPGETPDTVNDTIANAENLTRTVLFIACGVRIYPGTRLHHIAMDSARITESRNMLEPVYYEPEKISIRDIDRILESRSKNHANWVYGEKKRLSVKMPSMMYAHGYTGPLWENLIQ